MWRYQSKDHFTKAMILSGQPGTEQKTVVGGDPRWRQGCAAVPLGVLVDIVLRLCVLFGGKASAEMMNRGQVRENVFEGLCNSSLGPSG